MIEAILKDREHKFVARIKIDDLDVGMVHFKDKMYNYCMQAGQHIFWETTVYHVRESDIIESAKP